MLSPCDLLVKTRSSSSASSSSSLSLSFFCSLHVGSHAWGLSTIAGAKRPLPCTRATSRHVLLYLSQASAHNSVLNLVCSVAWLADNLASLFGFRLFEPCQSSAVVARPLRPFVTAVFVSSLLLLLCSSPVCCYCCVRLQFVVTAVFVSSLLLLLCSSPVCYCSGSSPVCCYCCVRLQFVVTAVFVSSLLLLLCSSLPCLFI